MLRVTHANSHVAIQTELHERRGTVWKEISAMVRKVERDERFGGSDAVKAGFYVKPNDDVDTEMECEVEKEQEQEQELELTQQIAYERNSAMCRPWKWADLQQHPHPAFYALSTLQVRVPLTAHGLPRPSTAFHAPPTDRPRPSTAFHAPPTDRPRPSTAFDALSTLQLPLNEGQQYMLDEAYGIEGHDGTLPFPASLQLSSNVVRNAGDGFPQSGERRMGVVKCCLEWHNVSADGLAPLTVGLSLAEAQALRVALLGGGGGGGVRVGVRVLDSGTQLARTHDCPDDARSASLAAELRNGQLMLRFFNNDSWFSVPDLTTLRSSLAHVAPSHLHYFYHAALSLRRRTASPEASVFELFPTAKTLGQANKERVDAERAVYDSQSQYAEAAPPPIPPKPPPPPTGAEVDGGSIVNDLGDGIDW